VLTVLLVLVLDQGVRGWFIAGTATNAIGLAIAARIVPWHRRAGMDWQLVRSALVYSLPLMPHFLSQWALQLADRSVIAGLVSETRLGVYSLAANLTLPVMMLMIAVNQGFMPTYARSGTEAGSPEDLRRTVTTYTAIVVLLTVAGALLGPLAVGILAPPAYADAASLVPWLVLGYGFLGLYFIPMNGATLGAGRRLFAWVATLAAAAINLSLVVLLVPPYGLLGAAVASALGYFALLILIAVWAHSGLNTVTYDVRRTAVIALLAASAFVGAKVTAPAAVGPGLAISVAWVLALGAALATSVRRL